MLNEKFAGLGLENEVDPVPEITVDENVDQTVETEVAEIVESADAVEEAQETQGELEKKAATLEALYIALENSIEAGGMPPEAQPIIANAVNDVVEDLGPAAETPIPAVESFGGTGDKVNATRLSMEAIGKTLKAIWIAIKNAVFKVGKMIADFFAKIFGGVKKVKEKAQALMKAADGMKAGKGKIQVRSVGKLSADGKATAASFQTGMDNLIEALKVAHGPYLAANDKVMAAVATSAVAAAAKDAKEEEVTKDLDAAVAAAGKPFEAVKGKAIAGGFVLEHAEAAKDAPGIKTSVVIPNFKRAVKEQVEESQEMDSLDQKATKELLASVIDICDLLEKEKAAIEASKKAREDASKALDKASEAVDKKDAPGAIRKVYTGVILRAYRSNYMGVVAKLTSIGFSASRTALVVAEKSIAVANK